MTKIAAAQAAATMATAAAAGIVGGGIASASVLAGGLAVTMPSAYQAIRAARILRSAENSPGEFIASAISLPTAKFLMTAGLLALLIGGGREWLSPLAFIIGTAAAVACNFAAMPLLLKRIGDGG